MAYDKARVGKRLKSLRIDSDYSLDKLSELSTVPVPTLKSYENGISVMGMSNAVKIAEALGCTLDRLVCRNE